MRRSDRTLLVLLSTTVLASGLAISAAARAATAGGIDVLADAARARQDWKLVVNRPHNVKAGLDFITLDGQPALRLTYQHAAGQNDYFRIAANVPSNAEGLDFDLKAGDVAGTGVLMVRLTDSTGQIWQHQSPIHARNKWEPHRLAFDKSVFTGHWDGVNDGQMHWPVKTVGIDFYRGPQADPAQGNFWIRNLLWRGAKLPPLAGRLAWTAGPAEPAALRRLRLDVGPHSPTPFVGEKYRGGMRFRLSTVNSESLGTSRIDYSYAADVDDYLMWTRAAPVSDAAGIEFTMRVSDNRADVRLMVTDARGTRHQLRLEFASSGTWQTFRVPFVPAAFHEGGPTQRFAAPTIGYVFMLYRGRLPADATHFAEIKDFYALVDNLPDQETVGVYLDLTAPSGVALVGEKTRLSVSAVNRLAAARSVVLTLRQKRDDGGVTERPFTVCLRPEACWSTELTLPADEPSFTGLSAEVREAGQPVGSAKSALLVVRPMPNDRQTAPDAFFGAIHGEMDFEAAQRIGISGGREIYTLFSDNIYARPPEEVDRRAAEYQRRGMWLILCLDPNGLPLKKRIGLTGPADFATPSVQDGWREIGAETARRFKGRLRGIEIWNEPDGTFWHSTDAALEEAAGWYLACLKAGYEGVKSVDPALPVFGIDTSGRDFNRYGGSNPKFPGGLTFAKAVLPRAAAFLDVYSAHVYPPLQVGGGEAAALAGDDAYPLRKSLLAMCDLMQAAGKPPRIMPTEIGYGLKAGTVVSAPDLLSLDWGAAVAQQLIVLKSVPAVEGFALYDFHDHDFASGHGTFRLFDCNADFLRYRCAGPLYPSLSAVGYATTAYELHASRPVKEVVLPAGLSGWRFDRADGRSVVALFANQPAPVQLLLEAAPQSTQAVNFFGRTVGAGRRIELAVSRNPVFISADTRDAANLERALAGGRP